LVNESYKLSAVLLRPVAENVSHLFNTQANDAVVRAASFGGQPGDSETSIVWVSNAFNEFCVFKNANLSVRSGGVHRATTGELSHWHLTGIGERAQDCVTGAGDVNTDGCSLAMVHGSVDGEPKESFE